MLERQDPSLSLASEINTATRSLHTALNRLITTRLPLALPPHTPDSSLYAAGLVHFAHILLTFESLWADVLRDVLVNPSPPLAAFLDTLRPRGLTRSSRLKRDLEHLLGLHPTDLEVLLASYPGDKVAAFCAHIQKSVHRKPWTLVSYAWCFYMAVFSGGRWIRGCLLDAPADYWPAGTDVVELQHRGLSFWHFPGQHDGQDIKADFKSRLAGAETLFSPGQRVDIIEEAKNIFTLCATLVDELDAMVAAQSPAPQTDLPAQLEHTAETEKSALLAPLLEQGVTQVQAIKSKDVWTSFFKRPQITGILVAVGCLACVASFKFQ
ncbi:hypothetical protein NX059_000977 [Plenodomus lindquistii]|nr:hypothetical protein NX059_000977 [Plenodomus lindquistii]